MKRVIIILFILIATVLIAKSSYEIKGETVVDTATGLVWQRCNAGSSGEGCRTGKPLQLIMEKAVDYCHELKLGGFSWRLPSVYELRSLVDYRRYKPASNAEIFLNTESSGYWSSTEDPNNSWETWVVNFENGEVAPYLKTNVLFVRCIADKN